MTSISEINSDYSFYDILEHCLVVSFYGAII